MVTFNNLNNFRKMLGLKTTKFSENALVKDTGFHKAADLMTPLDLEGNRSFQYMYNISTYVDRAIEGLMYSTEVEPVHGYKWFDFSFKRFRIGDDFRILNWSSFKWLVTGDLIPILSNEEFEILKKVTAKASKKYEQSQKRTLRVEKEHKNLGVRLLKECFEDLTSQEEMTDEQVKKIFKAIVLGDFLVPKLDGEDDE